MSLWVWEQHSRPLKERRFPSLAPRWERRRQRVMFQASRRVIQQCGVFNRNADSWQADWIDREIDVLVTPRDSEELFDAKGEAIW